jgi:hypothetical protein
VKTKKISSWITLFANLGVIGGLVFVGLEVRQNTTQIRAEASYSINDALSVLNSSIYTNSNLADIVVRGEKSFLSLSEVEQRQFIAYQYDRVNLATHVLGLEDDGLSHIHFPYVDRLVQDFHRSPGLQEFLAAVEDDWVGVGDLYERLRVRDD